MNNMDKNFSDGNQGEIVIYQTDDGLTKIDVRFVDETVWLMQQQMRDLFQSSKSNISEHIKHIFEEGELDEKTVVRKFRTTAISTCFHEFISPFCTIKYCEKAWKMDYH